MAPYNPELKVTVIIEQSNGRTVPIVRSLPTYRSTIGNDPNTTVNPLKSLEIA